MYLIKNIMYVFLHNDKKNSMFVFAELHYAQGFGWRVVNSLI
jgi:hypothetical protein